MENNHTWRPTTSVELLRQRAILYRRVRSFFDDRDFFEVETPLLSNDVVVDRYIEPIGITKTSVTGATRDQDKRLWLQTSPEFGMKRLVADGADAIYQICKAFRQSESGDRHNPEFTMLEWYRVGDDYQSGMDLLSEFVEEILQSPKCEKISYRDAFVRFAKVDPFRSSLAELKAVLSESSDSMALEEMKLDESNRDAFLNLILVHLVEPKLGVGQPMILFDWPASQSALATVRHDDVPVAERFELYLDGVELANGYHELLDPDELRRRNSVVNQARQKDGRSMLPESSRLLAAMENGLPDCVGVALGMDRLTMVLVGLKKISEVVSFPIDRA